MKGIDSQTVVMDSDKPSSGSVNNVFSVQRIGGDIGAALRMSQPFRYVRLIDRRTTSLSSMFRKQ